jgi:hypothetical protein
MDNRLGCVSRIKQLPQNSRRVPQKAVAAVVPLNRGQLLPQITAVTGLPHNRRTQPPLAGRG